MYINTQDILNMYIIIMLHVYDVCILSHVYIYKIDK